MNLSYRVNFKKSGFNFLIFALRFFFVEFDNFDRSLMIIEFEVNTNEDNLFFVFPASLE